jgi:hypothetical protein
MVAVAASASALAVFAGCSQDVKVIGVGMSDGGIDEASLDGGPPPIFVSGVLAPQLVTPATECAYTNDPSQPALSSGILDVSLRDTYAASYLLGNRLAAVGDGGAQTMTSYVNVQGANVRITTSDGDQLTSFTGLASAVIARASGGMPGYAALPGVTTIDRLTVQSVAPPAIGEVQRILTFVRFFGQTLGGQYVESDEFEFPVEVCRGCLILFSSQDVNPSFPSPNCAGNPAAPAASVTVPCSAEDLPVDCSACASFSSACQGVLAGLEGGIPFDADVGE